MPKNGKKSKDKRKKPEVSQTDDGFDDMLAELRAEDALLQTVSGSALTIRLQVPVATAAAAVAAPAKKAALAN